MRLITPYIASGWQLLYFSLSATVCSEKKENMSANQPIFPQIIFGLLSSSTVGGLHTVFKLCWLALVDTHGRDPIWLSSGRFWNGVHNIFFFTIPVNCRTNKWGNRAHPWRTPHFRVGGSCGEGFCHCITWRPLISSKWVLAQSRCNLRNKHTWVWLKWSFPFSVMIFKIKWIDWVPGWGCSWDLK